MGSKSNVVWIVVMIVGLTAAGTWLGLRWVGQAFSGMMESGRHEYEAGSLLGRSVTESICLDSAFARHGRTSNRSMTRQIDETVFLQSCLRASAPSGVCDSVPATDNLKGIMQFQLWSTAQCRARGLTDRTCPRLLQVVSTECRRRAAGG